MIPGIPFWIVITVCLADNPRDCRDIVGDDVVPTQIACLVEGTIAGTQWINDHEGWAIQQIRCTQEEPKDEAPT